LNKLTSPKAIKRNEAHWSSSYEVMKRFFELEPVLNRNRMEFESFIPSIDAVKGLHAIRSRCQDF